MERATFLLLFFGGRTLRRAQGRSWLPAGYSLPVGELAGAYAPRCSGSYNGSPIAPLIALGYVDVAESIHILSHALIEGISDALSIIGALQQVLLLRITEEADFHEN